MTINLSAKNYHILKVRYYADKKLLDAWHDGAPVPRQHRQRAEFHWKFFWGLVEKVTAKKQDFWYDTYLFFTVECAEEELGEDYGIFCFNVSDGHKTYYIPKKYTEIIKWTNDNVNLPFKILKRANISFHNLNDITHHFRNESIKINEEFKHKIFVKENTRNIFLEKTEKKNEI